MKFYNHCTKELSNEAKRVISTKTWHPTYKEQLLCRVEDMLEAGEDYQAIINVPFKMVEIEEEQKYLILLKFN